jgi:hypothetical protein
LTAAAFFRWSAEPLLKPRQFPIPKPVIKIKASKKVAFRAAKDLKMAG